MSVAETISNNEDIFVYEKNDVSSIPMESFESITNPMSKVKKNQEEQTQSNQEQQPSSSKPLNIILEDTIQSEPKFNLNVLSEDEPQVRELDPERARMNSISLTITSLLPFLTLDTCFTLAISHVLGTLTSMSLPFLLYIHSKHANLLHHSI